VRAFVLGIILSVVFAFITVYHDNRGVEAYPSASLLPVMPYVMLMVAGLLVNPLLRRLKFIRTFDTGELLLVFVITAVGSGVATWGLCGPIISHISALSNRAWSTDQSQWDAYAMPFAHEDYYISEKGTQIAAKELYDADREYEQARAQYRVARELLAGHEDIERIDSELKELASAEDSAQRAAEEKALLWPRSQAERLLEMATESWDEIGEDLDPQTVADTFADKIDELKEQRDKLREDLKELNKASFDEVDRIRKGLPEGERAMPGCLIAPGEGVASFKARRNRLKVGTRILAEVEALDAILAQSIDANSSLPGDWSEKIETIASALEEIAHIKSLEERRDKWGSELAELEATIEAQKEEQRRLRHLRRYSTQDGFEIYDDKVKDLEKSTEDLEKSAKKLKEKIEKQVDPQLLVCDRVVATQEELRAIAGDARSAQVEDYEELRDRLVAQKQEFVSFDASYKRFWLGDARWRVWIGPLMHWFLLVVVVYTLFLSFNTLIYRQWSYHEKLIYPIAEVTTLLADSGGSSSDKELTLFRNGLFWFGVVLSAGILGWNHMALKGIIPNVSPVKLEFGWWDIREVRTKPNDRVIRP